MKPAFRIEADGADITRQLADRLISIRITDEAGQTSDRLELAVDDRDQLLEVPRSGAWLKVYLGYDEGGKKPAYMGTFAVDEVDLSNGPRSMTVRATALETAPTMKEQRTQSWHNTTLQQVAQTIAQRNGLQLRISSGLGSRQIKHEDQTAESDIAFLTRLAKKLKLTAKPVDKVLWITERASNIPANGSSTPAAVPVVQGRDTLEWRATLKNRGAYSAVRARYLDKPTKKEKVVRVGSTSGNLQTYEEKELYKDQAEAQKAAQSRLQTLQSGEVSITFSMLGTPEITAEGMIKLEGFRKLVDGEWYLKTVTHTLDSQGYRTSVACGTKGDDNSSWTSGRGANDNASGKGGILARAADSSRGMSTRGGPDGGNQACVWAVNKVMRNAGLSVPWGNANSVPVAEAALKRSAIPLTAPEPGAIAIFNDSAGPAHIGIVTSGGNSIISNSSSRASFSWVASPSEYRSYYGGPIRYYRLR
jgi:phage protein D